MHTRALYSLTVMALSLLSPAAAKITLPSVVGDNMVLQQQTSVNIWGEASSGAEMTVTPSWSGKACRTKADRHGRWVVRMDTPSAGGPHSITITEGPGTDAVTLSDILIGEVWLCSGQSNMEMPVKGYTGQYVEGSGMTIMEASPADDIRMINFKTSASQTPQSDCESTGWMQSSPANVAGFSATAYYFGHALHRTLGVPIGLICSSWGGSKIESWMGEDVFTSLFPEVSLRCLEMPIDSIARPKDNPALLFNAMIHPLKDFAIRGAIWYQGESNLENSDMYARYFPAMVESWRALWGQGEFPFYYVQIAPYGYGNPDGTEAAAMRQVQLQCSRTIPNCGMVTIGDIGSDVCIHPPYKRQVGDRLAMWALAKTYGRDGIPYSGPLAASAVAVDGKVLVSFEHAENGMSTCDNKFSPITGFEMAGADGVFYPAKAYFVNSRCQIKVESPQVPEPVEVRFAYRNYEPVGLFSVYGLPASPFVIKVAR